MTAVLTTLLTLFIALVGPNDTTVYVAPSQVVAIIDSRGVGACPTTLTTANQPVFVCESTSEVKRKLEASEQARWVMRLQSHPDPMTADKVTDLRDKFRDAFTGWLEIEEAAWSIGQTGRLAKPRSATFVFDLDHPAGRLRAGRIGSAMTRASPISPLSWLGLAQGRQQLCAGPPSHQSIARRIAVNIAKLPELVGNLP